MTTSRTPCRRNWEAANKRRKQQEHLCSQTGVAGEEVQADDHADREKRRTAQIKGWPSPTAERPRTATTISAADDHVISDVDGVDLVVDQLTDPRTTG